MEVKDIIMLAWRNKKKLIIIPLLAGLATLLIFQQKPVLYEARGTVVIKDKSLAPWMDSADRSAAESEFANIYSHLMKLRTFINDVSERLPFEADPAVLNQAVTIDYQANSNTIVIIARLSSPEQAASLVNCIIDYFPLYLDKIQYGQPVTVNIIEQAAIQKNPITTNKIYIFGIVFFIASLWIMNIIMFSNCLIGELDYEQTI